MASTMYLNHAVHRFGLVIACVAVLSTTGCIAISIPSARFAPPSPTPAVRADAAKTVNHPIRSGQASENNASDNTEPDSVPSSKDVQSVPFIAACPNNECPPLFVLPSAIHFPCWWPWCHHHKQQQSLLETEMQGPISRFHPVPTQPVFSPRPEYSPPELMFEPIPGHSPHALRHAPPHLLPRAGTLHPVQAN